MEISAMEIEWVKRGKDKALVFCTTPSKRMGEWRYSSMNS
jgi:hypothetical protein